MKRWTENANDDALAVMDNNVDPKYQTMLRYASLSSHCNRLCHVASQFVETFNKARSEIANLTRRYEEMCKVNIDGISNLTKHVHDLTRVKAKGKIGAKIEKKKKPRKCGNCTKEGHTRNKCPQLELTLRSLDSSSCLLNDNDVDVYEKNNEVWPSQLGTLFGGYSLEVFTESYFCVAGALMGLLKPGRMSMFGTLLYHSYEAVASELQLQVCNTAMLSSATQTFHQAVYLALQRCTFSTATLSSEVTLPLAVKSAL
ncbi:Uncharacterized protein TCM_014539 [Theobroma cacao]|uniref:CCHC-type domain-containing protein n=1 Tax=Theobroma cacao TaxID=3641 RepID=A0A061G5M2_THECC|nr:Uncharacterized protein TCM_014539 [Theobroma cacao]